MTKTRLCNLRLPALMMIASFTLGACSSLSSMDPFAGGSVNFASGSPAGEYLSGSDRDALSAAFVAAMNGGKVESWRGRRAAGSIAPGGYALANLKPDPAVRVDAARGDLEITHVVETELGGYVLTRNSNVRSAPGTHGKALEVLPSGTRVDVVGRVRDRNWMLVAADGVVRGYVFGDLLIKAPGSELELAGGPMRKPLLCRSFNQRVDIRASRYEWSGAACNDGSGWRLAREPEPDENAPEELFEF